MDIHLEKQVWGNMVEGLKCHLLILSISIYSVLIMSWMLEIYTTSNNESWN